MKGFKHYLSLAAGVGILLLTLALANADWVLAQASKVTQVFVTNTAASPVPTLAQGTTTVGGTVNAAQSGPWDVGLTGTPNVNVASMPTVNAQQSGVWMVDVNGIALVRDVDHAARNLYNPQGNFGPSLQIGEFSACATGFGSHLTVPVGKRLVIEYVSGNGQALAGQPLHVSLTVPGVNANYDFLPSKWGGDGTTDFFVLSQATRLYADSGAIAVCVERIGTMGTATFRVALAGYLVDFP